MPGNKNHKSTKVPNHKPRARPDYVPEEAAAGPSRKGKGKAPESDGMELDYELETKPLHDKTVCISGCRDERPELAVKLRQLGAEYELELKTATSLVVTDHEERTAKIQSAIDHDISVVRPSFVDALFEAWSEDKSVDMRALIEEHTAFKPRPGIFSGLYFAITNVALKPPHIRADLIKLIKDHGGFFDTHFSQKVDYLLFGDDKPFKDPKVEGGLKWRTYLDYHNKRVEGEKVPIALWVEWLHDSLRVRRLLDTDLYLVPNEKPPRPSSSAMASDRVLQNDTFVGDEEPVKMATNRTLKRSNASADADDVVEYVAPKKKAKGLDVDDLLLRKTSSSRTPLAPTASDPNVDSADAETSARAMQSRSTVSAFKKPAGPKLGKAMSVPPSHKSTPPKQFFKGMVISCKGLADSFEPKVRSMVNAHGGTYTEDWSRSDVDRVIVPLANPPPEIDLSDPRNVSIYWLERCLFMQDYIEPSSWFMSQSFRFQQPHPNASSYAVAVSGFDVCDEKIMERVLTLLGIAKTVDVPTATHVVSCGEGAAKAGRARKLGKPVVDVEWFLDLMRKNPPLPIEEPPSKPAGDMQMRTAKSSRSSLDGEESSRPLAGCFIAISNKLNNTKGALTAKVLELGGGIDGLDQGATHLLHISQRANDTVKEAKQAREAGIPICHPAWLDACEKAGFRIDESLFPPTFDVKRALPYSMDSSAASSLAPRSRNQSLAPVSPAPQKMVEDDGLDVTKASEDMDATRASDELEEGIIPALRAPGLLDDPAFAAAPVPPPLPPSASQLNRALSRESSEMNVDPVPGPSHRPPPLDLDMKRSVSAPGAINSPRDLIASLLSKGKNNSSSASLGEEEKSAKEKKRERLLARKKSSAARARPPEDYILPKLPIPDSENEMQMDNEAAAMGGESLLVTWRDDAAIEARKKMQQLKRKPTPVQEEDEP